MGVVEAMWNDTHPGDPDETGRLLYRLGSAYVHAQIHGSMMLLAEESATPVAPGVSSVGFRLGLGRMCTYASSVVAAVHTTGSRLCRHRGLFSVEWSTRLLPVLQSLRSGLPGPPSPVPRISPKLMAEVMAEVRKLDRNGPNGPPAR